MLRTFVALLLTYFIAVAHGTLSAETVRIGVLTDLSGPMAFWGKQTRLGAQMAQDKINSNGGDVKLVFGDHQLQGKNAVTEFQKLTDFDAIDILYNEFTPAAVAIAPIAKSKNLPMIYSAAATSPLNAAKLIFKTYMNYEQGCRMIALHWKNQGLTNVGILKANLEFADLCLHGAKAIYPEIAELNYNPGDDVDSQLLVFKNRDTQAIINVGFTPDFLRMFKSLQESHYYPYVGANEDALGEIAQLTYSKILERTVVFSMPNPTSAFVKDIKKRDPNNNLEAIEAAGMTYLHVQQLYAAVVACRQAGHKEYDHQCAYEHIAKSKPDKLIGFEGWRDRVADFRLDLMQWNKDQASMRTVG